MKNLRYFATIVLVVLVSGLVYVAFSMYNDKRAQEELSKKNLERFFKRGAGGTGAGLNIPNESFIDRLGVPKD